MSDEKIVAVEAAPEAEVTMADVVRDPEAPIMTMKKLLEAGVHYGHQTRRWNPKMGKYIYGARNNYYLIDLGKTVSCVNEAYAKLKEIVEAGGKVLFVGTKPSSQQVVIEQANDTGSFYIANRWLGGTLTNFRTILGRTKRLKDLQAMDADGTFDSLPKKEVAILRKEMEKLSKNLEGIKEMRRLPQAIVVTDPSVEHNAITEAKKLNIPVFGICDTNDDPDTVKYVIPSNNDASSAVSLLVKVLADAIREAKGVLTLVAHTKDEGEEATMKDAVRAADILNEQRRAAIRAQRQEREARNARIQAEKAARWAAKKAAQEAPKAEEAPAPAPAAEGEAK